MNKYTYIFFTIIALTTRAEAHSSHEVITVLHESKAEAKAACYADVEAFGYNGAYCGLGGWGSGAPPDEDGLVGQYGAGNLQTPQGQKHHWTLWHHPFGAYYAEVQDTNICGAEGGNPCNISSGIKTEIEIDYQATDNSPLEVIRFYSSGSDFAPNFAKRWKHNYSTFVNRKLAHIPVQKRRQYTSVSGTFDTMEDACTKGWSQLRYNAYGGLLRDSTKFSVAFEPFTPLGSGGSCSIQSNGKKVADIVIRATYGGGNASSPALNYVKLQRPNGQYYIFNLVNGVWVNEFFPRLKLEKVNDHFELIEEGGKKFVYNNTGQIFKIIERQGIFQTLYYDIAVADGGDDDSDTLDVVTDNFGNKLEYHYDSGSRLSEVTTPRGTIAYSYDINGNLVTTTYENGSTKQYVYENTKFLNHLTGVIDENGSRYATWDYNNSGKAILSEHAGSTEKVTFSYQSNSSTTTDVSNSTTASRVYEFTFAKGTRRIKSVAGDPCITCNHSDYKAQTFNNSGQLETRTDWNGNVTTYEYTNEFVTKIIRATGSPEEDISVIVWDERLQLQKSISDGNKLTEFTYDTNGNILTETITDTVSNKSRTTTYTYSSLGLVTSVDGSRDDVSDTTTFEYNLKGQLAKIVNALGHITSITSYDPSGNPLSITDANGTVIVLTWDLRGRLLSTTVAGSFTQFAYDLVGQLTRATQADGSYLQYQYDDAHRLIGISDNASNKITYVLDKMGNRTSTQISDINNNISFSQTALYDKLSHLKQSLGANSQKQILNYDLNHNPLNSTDALNHQTQSNYDALDRLIKSIDPDAQETNFEYDNQDNLTKVIDAKGLETSYIYNGFDEVTSQTSPDTGITTFTYDKAGNRTSMTSARGITVNYSYDALNRLNKIDYTNDTLDITHTYDNGINGIGRLTSTTDASGTTNYGYDAQGNLLNKTFNNGTTSYTTNYSYNNANRLSGITYPSGNSLQYQRAANGDISQITTTINGITQTLLSNASYQPFGPLKSFTYGNALEYTANFDKSSRLTEQSATGIQQNSYSYSAVDNLVSFDNLLNGSLNQIYDYDTNDRLITADGNYGNYQYVFDVVGNRTQKTASAGTDDYNYAFDSHHLQTITGASTASYQYDAVGNTTDNGSYQFIYGEDNRLHQVMDNGVEVARYSYNAQGQRINKQVIASLVGDNSTPSLPLIPPSEQPNATVYEDGEGNASAWDVYDNTPAGATISTVFDNDSNSNAIKFTGEATKNGYRLGHNNANNANAWANSQQKIITWESKFSESFVVYIPVQTTLGFRYLYYTPVNTNRGIHVNANQYIHHGVGTRMRNGVWHTAIRDLEADLQEFEPDNQIISVNGFLIRGSGKIDNIALIDNFPPPPPIPTQIVYEDAENSGTTGWGVYDNTPVGAIISNVFDSDKNSNVIEFNGSATQNGYRLGHNNANHVNAWGNTNHKTLSWESKFNQSFVVYIGVQTTEGFRYLYYTPINTDRGIHPTANRYIHHGLGTNLRDGVWHTTTRNLEADLQEFEPNNQILSVNGFLIRGSGRVDNIKLSGESTTSNNSNTDYIYDQQGRLISEISSENQKDYVYFNNQPFAMIEGNQVYYYHNNHLGTPETITNQNQSVVWQATYTPYGEANITTEAVVNNIRLPGQYFDAETKLHYNYFRYYDSFTGRYVTSDPIGLAGGINTYGYVGGNPLRFIDPLGLYGTPQMCLHPRNWKACAGEYNNFIRTLRGKSIKYIKKHKPKNWKRVTSDNGKGFKWVDKKGVERFRCQRPKKRGNQWEREKNGYMRWKNKDDSFLDIDGNPVSKADPLFNEKTHIPYEGLWK